MCCLCWNICGRLSQSRCLLSTDKLGTQTCDSRRLSRPTSSLYIAILTQHHLGASCHWPCRRKLVSRILSDMGWMSASVSTVWRISGFYLSGCSRPAGCWEACSPSPPAADLLVPWHAPDPVPEHLTSGAGWWSRSQPPPAAYGPARAGTHPDTPCHR